MEEPTCTAVCKVSWLRTFEDNGIIPSYFLSLPLRMKRSRHIEKRAIPETFLFNLYYIFSHYFLIRALISDILLPCY